MALKGEIDPLPNARFGGMAYQKESDKPERTTKN
jgi:hypothetical protein